MYTGLTRAWFGRLETFREKRPADRHALKHII